MAEVAGLALGVVGVAGLYSVVLQVFEQISDAAKFNSDFVTQNTKFNTVKAALQVWGNGTGFAADGRLVSDHHPVLDDPRVLYDVQSALACIKDACAELKACLEKSSPSSGAPRESNGGAGSRARVTMKISSAGRRLRWAFQEKTKVEDMLNQIICLVGLLYKIARPKDAASLDCNARLTEVLATSQEQTVNIAQGLVNQAKELRRQKQHEIERWLDAPDSQSMYHAALLKALPGTCHWITDDELLQPWINRSTAPSQGSIECLWLYSRIPGAGKTIAASKLVESLQRRQDCSVAYFFCTHESNAARGFEGILRAWVLQLARCSGWELVEEAYDRSVEDDRPVDFWIVLRSLLSKVTSSYLVLDGLDEVEDQTMQYSSGSRADFLRNLLATLPLTTARLLIVSRYEKDIDRSLSIGHPTGSQPAISKLEITSKQTAPDIGRVAESQLLRRFPAWTASERATATKALVERGDGMFVLLYAILEQLDDATKFYEAINVISRPLSGHSSSDMLQQAYHKQIQRILGLSPSVRDLCLTVLLWVQHSSRPLKVGELLDALEVLHRKQPQSPEVSPIHTRHDLESRILRHCTILLSLQDDAPDFYQSTLHLAHYSVKEFLQCTGFLEDSQFSNWKLFQGGQPANAYLAKACLLYLLQPKFSTYPAERMTSSHGVFQYKENFGNHLSNNSVFYGYAAAFWWRHLDMSCSKPALVTFLNSGIKSWARQSPSSSSSENALESLTQMLTQTEIMLEVMSPKETGGYNKLLPLDIELGSLCLAFLGISGEAPSCNYKVWRHYCLGVFSTKSDEDSLVKARDVLAYPARSWHYRHLDPMWRVLDLKMWQNHLFSIYGSDQRKLRLQGRLLEAMCIHSTGLTALLVEQGADINYTWPSNETTLELYTASTRATGSLLFFQALQTHFGASTVINKPLFPVHIPTGREVFRAASSEWLSPRVLWGFLYGNVLQRKVLTAWRSEEDSLFASDVTDLDTIRIMINWHIEVNNRSLFHPSTVHGAVLNEQASREAQLRILDELFANQGDANIGPWLRPVGTFVGENEKDPTIRESVLEMVLQLLPSSGLSHGRTFGSLLKLIEQSTYFFNYDRDDMIKKVLSKAALRYNSAGWVKPEKLSLAVRRGDEDEVKSMLENGANVNRSGMWYGSALYVAAYIGNKSMVQLLLEHHADPDMAVKTRILRLELERDFEWSGLWRKSLSREDSKYTPLHAAASRGHLDVVRILLERGADVNLDREKSGTALYFAVRSSRPRYEAHEWNLQRTGGENLQYWQNLNRQDREKWMKMINLLLDSGSQVNKCGGRHWTPLQAACVIGDPGIITALLQKGADPNVVGGEWGTALQAVLTNFPDPDSEAITKGQTLGDAHFPFVSPTLLFHSACLTRCVPLRDQEWDVVGLSRWQPPEDRALVIAQKLLEHGADPTLEAGPWGTAIHAAAYFSSLDVLQLVLDGRYSDATARRRAANTRGGAMGLAINGALVTARFDKTVALVRYASAELRWAPLLEMRVRRAGYGAFLRLRLLLNAMWAVRDFLVIILLIALLTAVGTPIYLLWNDLDERSKQWDPRLGGLWMLFSLLAAGYVVNLREGWASDTAW